MPDQQPDRPKNLDERLKALTHSVELLASLHRDNEARLAKTDEHMHRMMHAIERLAGIAGNHEDRISDLEGQQ